MENREIEYPIDNPSALENEKNYLAKNQTLAYLEMKRGNITVEDYQLVVEGIQNQKLIMSGWEAYES